MIRSAAWHAVPTVPSTIPQLSLRPVGSSMLPQPWISQVAILPFTGVWASYLLFAQHSTTPNGSMVSLSATARFPSHWSVMPGYFSAPKQTVILVKENFLHFLEKSRCNLFCTSKRKGIRCGTKDTKCRFGHSLLAYLFLKRKISSIS